MTLEKIYLICAFVGFLLSIASVLLHSVDFHAGGGGDGGGELGVGGGEGDQAHGFSKFNFTTASAFLAWFGGAGYLLERYSTFGFAAAAGAAGFVGLVGATIVFLLVTKVLLKNERDMHASDFEMVGVLGRVSSPIREAGIGEMIYSQQESRRSVAIRAENETEVIPRDTEVVVTKYEKGIAYVKRWDELSGME